MKNLIWLLISCAVLSCQSKVSEQNIADSADYNQFLEEQPTQQSLETLHEEIQFWENKLSNSPNNFTYISKLAGLKSNQFRLDGLVEHIHTSDSLYKKAIALNPFSNAGLYQALSSNSITKHEFVEAKNYAEMALAEGDSKTSTYYMLFDALMELGEYERATGILNMQKNKSAFDYLVRASKLADHNGDLDLAIALMEQGFERVKANHSLFTWAKSNLGDMYGHAGRIQDSYNAYLEVLNKNPEHWHSLQGIAWINFAHDKNTTEAKRILNKVKAHINDPQINFILAEIAEYENNADVSSALKKEYYAQASSPKYLGMYNKYLILLEAEDLQMADAAIARASAEQVKRPTPEMYDLLAWSYFQNGNNEKALELAKNHIEDKSSHPEVLYHLGVIFKNNKLEKKGNTYLKQALESTFELGPLTTEKIKQALKS
ncbi:tetratricopeptide repeat protein [Roseivirga echinicomitans]